MTISKLDTLCVIPARGGSKTVPGKNIKIVGGKPLIEYVIETVLSSQTFGKIILSTDSEKIANIVKKKYCDIEIPFVRPSEFASDETSLTDVIKHALEFYDNMNIKFQYIFSIQATTPFTKPETLQKAVKLLQTANCDSVVSVTNIIHFHPYRSYRFDNITSTILPLTEYTTERFLQKQDRPEAYGLTGGIFGRKRDILANWDGAGFALGDNVKGIVVSQKEALDIDTPLDMAIVEGLVQLEKSREYKEKS